MKKESLVDNSSYDFECSSEAQSKSSLIVSPSSRFLTSRPAVCICLHAPWATVYIDWISIHIGSRRW